MATDQVARNIAYLAQQTAETANAGTTPAAYRTRVLTDYTHLVTSADWTVALTQAISDVASGGGGGKVLIPNIGTGDVFAFTSGFTLPSNVTIEGVGKPGLDFTGMASGTSFTLGTRSSLRNLWIQGPGDTSSVTAIQFAGPHIEPLDLNIVGFGTGARWTGTNTYIAQLVRCHIDDCGTAMDFLVGASTNYGERIGASASTFSNCGTFIIADDNADIHFTGCSFNHPTDAFGFMNLTGAARVFFNGGHWETNTAATPAGALVKITGGGRVWWSNVEFQLDGAFPVIVDHATESTTGTVSFVQCYAYFQPSDLGGSFAHASSETQVFAASGATTATVRTPFPSKQVRGSVSPGFTTLNPADPMEVPVATYAGGTNSSVLNLTWSPATTANTETLVRFG